MSLARSNARNSGRVFGVPPSHLMIGPRPLERVGIQPVVLRPGVFHILDEFSPASRRGRVDMHSAPAPYVNRRRPFGAVRVQAWVSFATVHVQAWVLQSNHSASFAGMVVISVPGSIRSGIPSRVPRLVLNLRTRSAQITVSPVALGTRSWRGRSRRLMAATPHGCRHITPCQVSCGVSW